MCVCVCVWGGGGGGGGEGVISGYKVYTPCCSEDYLFGPLVNAIIV